MKKLFTILALMSFVFLCACSGDGKQEEYVPEPMSEKVLASLQAEYRAGDMVVYGIPGPQFKYFAEFPSEALLQQHCPLASLYRIAEDKDYPILHIEITNDGTKTKQYPDGTARVNGIIDFPVYKTTIELAGNPQAIQEYLEENGFKCTVEKASVVTTYDYYNIIWVKCSDVSYYIRMINGEPEKVYTSEMLLADINN